MAVIRVLNLPVALYFLYCTVVQLNDPDPLLWTSIYAVATIVCVVAFLRRLDGRVAALVGLVALGWAALLLVRALPRVSLHEWLADFDAQNPDHLATGEAVGLLILFSWMALLAYSSYRAPAPRRSSS